MKQTNHKHFIIACICSVAVFTLYHSLAGGKYNKAYASLNSSNVDAQGEMVNYKPARKRHLSARLRQDVNQMLGLTGHDVAQIFDTPELVRRDLPTTIWQYRNDACVMDVYFTVDRVEDLSRANVAHFEVRSRDVRSDAAVSVDGCVQDLVANHTMISLINVDAIFKAK